MKMNRVMPNEGVEKDATRYQTPPLIATGKRSMGRKRSPPCRNWTINTAPASASARSPVPIVSCIRNWPTPGKSSGGQPSASARQMNLCRASGGLSGSRQHGIKHIPMTADFGAYVAAVPARAQSRERARWLSFIDSGLLSTNIPTSMLLSSTGCLNPIPSASAGWKRSTKRSL
jgi:hypothetical protein